MALHNLARVVSATTGTGTLTLGSAVSGFLSFADAGVVDGEQVVYAIRDGANSEIGLGIYTASGTTLSRSVIYESTNGGNAINCSGSQEVFITVAAERIGWQLALSESGASFANFTGVSGTWSSDGSIIKQTDTAASARYALINQIYPIAACAFELQVQVKTSGTSKRGGFVIGSATANTNLAMVAYIDPGGDTVSVERGGNQVMLNPSVTVNIDTWYTLRLVMFAGSCSVWLDGTFLGTGHNNITVANGSYLGLYSFGAEAWFRNIKAWTLPLPFTPF